MGASWMVAATAAQEAQAEPARGDGGAQRPNGAWDAGVRLWDAIPAPLRGKTLLAVLMQFGDLLGPTAVYASAD